MKKIVRKIAALSAAVMMMASMSAIGANAYNLTDWAQTSGGQYTGYIFTWLNGGTAPGTPLTVMGNSTVEAYTQQQRKTSYSLRGNMGVTTSVEGAGYGTHNDATNCDSMTVAIRGTTYVANPAITSSNVFVSTSAKCGSAAYSVTVKANS